MRGSLRKLGCTKSTLNKVRVRPLCVYECVCVVCQKGCTPVSGEDKPLYQEKEDMY
jgi:hypothetical protein